MSKTVSTSNPAALMLEKMRSAYLSQPYIPLKERLRVLGAIEDILHDSEAEICEAISKDFGNRSFNESRILEIAPCLMGVRYTRKRLKRWARKQSRHVSLAFFGARNHVLPQPKGIVGLIAPWNYPLLLVISPLTSAIAAGNRVMIKQATHSLNLCQLLKKKFAEKIPEDIISFFPGIKASDFSSLRYDHVIFTGSPEVGKTIMSGASQTLTPVTLELGGKSPTILTEQFELKTAVSRIMYAKLANAGQTCVAPDYLFVPEELEAAFIEEAKRLVPTRYPNIHSNDYTSIIDDKAYQRLAETIEDARSNGAEIIPLLNEDSDSLSRKLTPMIVRKVTNDMMIMRDEIFGPLLPVIPYRSIDEAIDYINKHERPLSLYMFTTNKLTRRRILTRTLSGSVAVNDCLFQVAQHDLPFGGAGNSGMGQYHAEEGFAEFSKMRPIFTQSFMPLNVAPPYGRYFDGLYQLVRKVKFLA